MKIRWLKMNELCMLFLQEFLKLIKNLIVGWAALEHTCLLHPFKISIYVVGLVEIGISLPSWIDIEDPPRSDCDDGCYHADSHIALEATHQKSTHLRNGSHLDWLTPFRRCPPNGLLFLRMCLSSTQTFKLESAVWKKLKMELRFNFNFNLINFAIYFLHTFLFPKTRIYSIRALSYLTIADR